MFDWSRILPPKRNDYEGHPLARYFLIALGCIFTFRGCVHYFAPDGGSGIIAGFPLATYPEGAVQAIINGFGVYGIGHLLEAAVVWLVIFRYRSLIPLSYAFILCSQLLAVALLAVKPLPVVPPGQIGIYIMLPLTALAFLLSIRRPTLRSNLAEAATYAARETQA